MATPRVSETPATQRQYATQLAISAALAAALRQLWASISPTSSDVAWDAFAAATRAVVPQYGQAVAVMSLDNYRAARVSAGVTTTPRLPAITPPPASKIDAGLEWAKRAEADLADMAAAILERVDAAMQKALMDEARETTVEAVEGDDKALGFRRVPRPDACYWCIEMAIRKTSRSGLAAEFKRYGSGGVMGGDEHWGVYKSRASAGQMPEGADQINRFHRNCHCVVEPIFSTDFNVPVWLHDMSDLYDATGAKGFRRALNAQRRGETAEDPRPALPAPSIQPAQVAAIADLLSGIDAAMRAAA